MAQFAAEGDRELGARGRVAESAAGDGPREFRNLPRTFDGRH
jgi:hypothetical protein